MANKRILVVLILVVSLCALCTLGSAEKFRVVTQETPLNVRDAPQGGNIIGSVRRGAVIEGTIYNRYWVTINYNGQTGYLYRGYLEPVNSSANTTGNTGNSSTSNNRQQSARTTTPIARTLDEAKELLPDEGLLFQVSLERAQTVRVWTKRSENTSYSRVLIKLPNHAYVVVVETFDNGWSRVCYSEGKYGFIRSRYISQVESAEAE
jgi:uncharacterized protein YgiM (DUF1202 family)